MAAGTTKGVLPHVVSNYGESEIEQVTAATDILTIRGVSGQTGDFLVARDSALVERFVIEKGGNVSIVHGGAVTDVLLKVKQVASGSGDILQILNSAGSKLLNFDSAGILQTMGVVTKAIASVASNASTSFSLTGLTTDSAVFLIPLKALTTGNGVLAAYAQGTTRVDVYAMGGSVASNTYAVVAFKTTPN